MDDTKPLSVEPLSLAPQPVSRSIIPKTDQLLLIALVPLWLVSYFADAWASRVMTPYAQFVKHDSDFWFNAKQPGELWVTLLACVLLSILHAWRWRSAAVIAVAALLGSWLVHTLKWIFGRQRPVTDIDPFVFEWFRGGLVGYFNGQNLSFASGHTQMAFMLAAALTFFVPRATIVWYAIAFAVAAERVAERAHYPSEVLLGAIVGILSFHAAHRVCLLATGQNKPKP